MNIDGLKAFLSIVDLGSFSAAARASGVPKSTLSKRIQQLEEDLQTRLLERTTRKSRLTPDGLALLDRARRLVEEADALARDFRDGDSIPRGRLRIAVPMLFGEAFMGRLAARYRRLWPDVQLDIVFTNRRVDLIEEDFDCAIRVGELADSSLIARAFARAETVPAAAPALLAGGNRPDSIGALRDMPKIAFASNRRIQHWQLSDGETVEAVDPGGMLVLGSITAVRQAAVEGAGVASLPSFLIKDDLAEGRLVQLLPDWRNPQTTLHLVYPSRRHLSARIRAFHDLLRETFPDMQLG